MTYLRFLILIFNTTHARSAFQAVIKNGKELCTVNTIIVLVISYFTVSQLFAQRRTPTYNRNNTVANAGNDVLDNHPVLQKDTTIHEGYLLMRQSDCYTCHADTKVMTAPSYMEIAEKYRKEKNVEPRLVNKVIAGGKGEWGNDRAMNPHPELLREDALKMVEYILQLKKINNVK